MWRLANMDQQLSTKDTLRKIHIESREYVLAVATLQQRLKVWRMVCA